MKKTYLFLMTCLFFSCSLFASHINTADLSYTCLGNNQYEVELRLNADCASGGLPLTVILDIDGGGSCTSTSFKDTLSQVSLVEIPLSCANVITNCQSGTSQGVTGYETALYKRVITLPSTMSTCSWIISYYTCCRYTNATNMMSGGSFYIEAIIADASLCNSSPKFPNAPIFFGYSNLQYHKAYTTIDVDGDSLVYSLAAPLESATTAVTYYAGSTPNNPLQTVGGVSFSNQTGEFSFKPLANQQVLFDILVEEYRNGSFIGSTRRAAQLGVFNNPSPSNNALKIDEVSVLNNGIATPQGTSRDFLVCAGQTLEFRVKVSDVDVNDSLYYNNIFSSIRQVYPTAAITSSYPNAPNKDTLIMDIIIPSVQDKMFTIGFSDNFCPIQNIQSFTFRTSCSPFLSTAILEKPRTKVTVFPNPFQQQTTFKLEGETNYETVQLFLFDMTGKLVHQVSSANQNQIQLDRNGMPQGLYIYNIYADGKSLEVGKIGIN